MLEEGPVFDNNNTLFPSSSAGRSSSHTSFSVRIIQLFFHMLLSPTFLHTFTQREQKQTHTYTHTQGINRLFLSRAAASRLVLMMTTGICAGARAGMAAYGHPKMAQSHRNHQQPCCRSPPSFSPLFPPSPLQWYYQHCFTILTTCDGAASVWLLQTFTSESHIPLCLEPKAYILGLFVHSLQCAYLK